MKDVSASADSLNPTTKITVEIDGERVAVYQDGRDIQRWQSTQGSSPHQVMILTIPKSGTYLLSEIVARLGYVDTHVHVQANGKSFTDYRFASIQDGRENHRELLRRITLTSVLERLAHGQFLVGHLTPNDAIRRALSGSKLVFGIRDLRDCWVSLMRWQAATGRGPAKSAKWARLPDGPEKMLGYVTSDEKHHLPRRAESMLPWLSDPDVCVLRYEELNGDSGETVQQNALLRLARHLDVESEHENFKTLLAESLGTDTLTLSSGRTQREHFWNDEVQGKFESTGLAQTNLKLGYD